MLNSRAHQCSVHVLQTDFKRHCVCVCVCVCWCGSGSVPERRVAGARALRVRPRSQLASLFVLLALEPHGTAVMRRARLPAAELRHPPAVRRRQIQRRRVRLLSKRQRSLLYSAVHTYAAMLVAALRAAARRAAALCVAR